MKQKYVWMTKDEVGIERVQAAQEGRDLAGLESEFAALESEDTVVDEAFQLRLRALLAATLRAPLRAGYGYVEPSDLEVIQSRRPAGPRRLAALPGEAVLADKVHGAWLGRCAGCLLGKPIEGWKSADLWPMLRQAGHEMVSDYLWRLGLTVENARQHIPNHPGFAAYDHMPEDDDTNYTIIGLVLAKRKGLAFRPEDVADLWLSEMAFLHTYTAERVAYRNFVNEVPPPASATLGNPYREWIGAQIRADFFGYVSLGRPEQAAALAWRDASISHVKNGIYGEMWVAAMLAGAAAESDLRKVLEIGLSEIPAQCRLAEAVRRVMSWHAAGLSYEEAVRRIHTAWDDRRKHDWCHTISNAEIVTVGLLWGEGDYDRSITRAVWPAFDTDCNGATVGSILGMVLGARALPDKWTGALHDTLHTGVSGYAVTSISATAAEMFEMYRQASRA